MLDKVKKIVKELGLKKNSRNFMINDILEEMTQSSLEFKVGGPFGAVVYKDGKIVGKGVNRVVGNNDPTAHAEMEAIRNACKNLKTFDLTGCELYATGYPCPMCMSAIIWANIKKVYYSADYKDAEKIGFRDDFIFKFLKNGCKDTKILELEEISKEKVVKLYKDYDETDKTMY
jgi:tRNA(Arg) A34 adenosine deaminase TadA